MCVRRWRRQGEQRGCVCRLPQQDGWLNGARRWQQQGVPWTCGGSCPLVERQGCWPLGAPNGAGRQDGFGADG